MATTVVAVAASLVFMITVHEAGHLAAGLLTGVPPEEFSVGFGPRLCGFTVGSVDYNLRPVLLGGYVTFEGDGPHDPRYPWLGRMVTITAGVAMNALLAMAAFWGLAAFGEVEGPVPARIAAISDADSPPREFRSYLDLRGRRITLIGDSSVEDWSELSLQLLSAPAGTVKVGLESGDRRVAVIPAAETKRRHLLAALRPAIPANVQLVSPDGPAAVSGFRRGDRVLRIEGRSVDDWREVQSVIRDRPGDTLHLDVARNGRRNRLTVRPEPRVVRGTGDTVGWIGVRAGPPMHEPDVLEAVRHGWDRTVDSVSVIVRSMWALSTGRMSIRRLMGPVQIVGVSDQIRDAGWGRLFAFMATLSVHLAVINLLPLPALDGGHLILILSEGIRGQAFEPETLATIQALGALLFFVLILAVTANDVAMLLGL